MARPTTTPTTTAVSYGGFRYRMVWKTYAPLRPSAGPPPHWRGR